MINLRPTLVLSLALISLTAFSQEDPEHYVWPKEPEVLQNLNTWQDMKLGILMHWGLYAKWGIVESWALCPEDEDWCRRGKYEDYFDFVKAYSDCRKEFNPIGFNPEKWAKAVREAGFKYLIFSTKHHDGFCMFDTKETDYKITGKDCPFNENPRANVAKEIFNAFRHEGLKTGAYFSKPDWHCPYYWWPNFPPADRNVNYNINKYPDRWQKYKDYTFNQVNELMTDYGKLDILWLDGAWVRPKATLNKDVIEWCKSPYDQDVDIPRIAKMAREKQPGILIVDRWVNGEFENYLTPEQKIPGKALSVPWESCVTMGDAWGWINKDHFKSGRKIIHMLCDVVAKGGNLLLGIGPSAEGDFDPAVYSRLKDIGNWMNTNGEAIYGTKPVSPYKEKNVAFTSKGKVVYAIYLVDENEIESPKEVLLNSFIPKKGSTIKLLGYNDALGWQKNEKGLIIPIPKELANKWAGAYAWVFVITTD